MTRSTPTSPTSATSTRGIQHELQLPAPPEAVWKALTDPAELPRWFPLAARGGATPGSKVVWSWLHFDWDLEVLEAQPPHLLRLRDLSSERAAQGPPCLLEIRLEGRGGSTTLRLVHSGFSADSQWDEMYDGTRRGWQDELTGLAHYLRHHAGKRRAAVMLRAPLSGASYADAWQRLTAPDGLAVLAAGGHGLQLRLGDPAPVPATLIDQAPGRNLLAVVPSWNDGLFRILLEGCFGRPEAILMPSTWGLPRERSDAIAEQLARRLSALFPGELKRAGTQA